MRDTQEAQGRPSREGGLRLGFLCHEFPPVGGGGASALDALTTTLAQRGHSVQVLTIGLGRETSEETDVHGRHIVRFGVGRRRVFAPSAWQLMRSYFALRYHTTPWVRQFQPDLLTAYFAFPAGRAALALKKKLDLPVVACLRGSDVPGFSNARWGAARSIHRSLVRPVWRHSDLLLANGRSLVKLSEQFMPAPKPANLANGVDITMFSPQPTRTASSRLRILFVGQLISRKRCQVVLGALKWLGDQGITANLTFVGDGPLRSTLRSMSRRLSSNVRVDLPGALTRDAMPEIYRQHDVLVHLSRAEGISNVLLEAMASGLCIVATHSVAAEICGASGKSCLIVESVDPIDVGKALLQVSMDPLQRGQMQKNARRLAESHEWNQVADRFEGHVTPLLKAA